MTSADSGFVVRVVALAELTKAERTLWASFCEADEVLQSPFFSYTYIRCVSEVRPGVKIAVIERDNTIVAFFPFQFASKFHALIGRAEPVGGHMTDAFGIIARQGTVIAPTDLLRLCGLNYIFFTHMPTEQEQYGLVGDAIDQGYAIDLSMGWESYWSDVTARQKHFVQETERRKRNLIKNLGPLRFEFEEPLGKHHLDKLIAAKRQQYRSTGTKDVLTATAASDLLYRLWASSEADCTGSLSTLYAGDTWVASHFGLRNRNSLHVWFPVYNKSLAIHSPGYLLLIELIRSAVDKNLSKLDRGTGTQKHKELFANKETSYFRGAWQSGHLLGNTNKLVSSVIWRNWRYLLETHSN